MTTIAVFAASRSGVGWDYTSQAHQLGLSLASLPDVTGLYGGENAGLQRVFADAFLCKSSKLHGAIVTNHVDSGMMMEGLEKVSTHEDFSKRKRHIYDSADIFIALPGGVGTLDEVFNFLTYSYEQSVYKPLILVDVNNIYSKAFSSFIEAGFLYPESMSQITFAKNIQEVIKHTNAVR